MVEESQVIGNINYIKLKTKQSDAEQVYAVADKQLREEFEQSKEEAGNTTISQISPISDEELEEICK